jgi:hypothetical protein
LETKNIHVKAICTDGDRSYLPLHIVFFNKYSHMIHEDIDNIANQLKNETKWPVADTIHCLKCQRCRLKESIGMKSSSSHAVNSDNMELILQLGPPLTLFTGAAKMREDLAIKLFTPENLFKLFEVGHFPAMYYMALFVFWYSAIASSDISTANRLFLLKLTFLIFRDIYDNYPKLNSSHHLLSFS